ncbi:MAG: hypothetical protein JWP69_1212 [Flaviaesturariibacter sp.]|nr:hypothetical protein [Flaviaesturariibacter sp.]
MQYQEAYIEVNPKVMMGKPVIKGTRITVELIIEKLAAGENETTILTDYPSLSREAILAALQFAANNLKADHIYPIAS